MPDRSQTLPLCARLVRGHGSQVAGEFHPRSLNGTTPEGGRWETRATIQRARSPSSSATRFAIRCSSPTATAGWCSSTWPASRRSATPPPRSTGSRPPTCCRASRSPAARRRAPTGGRIVLEGRRRDGKRVPGPDHARQGDGRGPRPLDRDRPRPDRAAPGRERASPDHRAAHRGRAAGAPRQLGVGHPAEQGHLVGRALPHLRARAGRDRAQLRGVPRARPSRRPRVGRRAQPQGVRRPPAVRRRQALHRDPTAPSS